VRKVDGYPFIQDDSGRIRSCRPRDDYPVVLVGEKGRRLSLHSVRS
jgi:hypothetical protein